ncbi:MAG: type II secretion system F family protein [Acidimicrobiales bacterium]
MTRLLLVVLVALAVGVARPGSTWGSAARARRRAWAARPSEAAPGPTSPIGPAGPTDPPRPPRRGLALTSRSVDLDHALLLETVARSLRSGSSLTRALGEAVAELPPSDAVHDLERALSAVRSGASVVAALERWSVDGRGRARVLAGTALTLGAELGGAPARSLDAAAAGLRDRAALAREVRALSSQARASAAVMVVGPPLFLVLASVADHRLPQVLLGSPMGLGCLVAGIALDAAGAWWMATLVRRVS